MVFTKQDFENFADKIVDRYIEDKTSLNSSILKIAEEHEFNPEQIKRLVESTNVKTFLKLFNNQENKEKNIEFDVADAGDILKSFYAPNHDNVKKVTVTKVTISKGSNMSDPHEFFGDMPAFSSDGEIEHYMEPSHSSPKPSRNVVILNLKKVAEEFTNNIYDEEQNYIDNLEKVSHEFKKVYGPSYEDFEKVALGKYGDDIVPILNDIREIIGWDNPYDASLEKTATLIYDETAELNTLEQMYQTKLAQSKNADAVRLIKQKLNSINEK